MGINFFSEQLVIFTTNELNGISSLNLAIDEGWIRSWSLTEGAQFLADDDI